MNTYIYNPIRVTLALPADVNLADCDWEPLPDGPAPQRVRATLRRDIRISPCGTTRQCLARQRAPFQPYVGESPREGAFNHMEHRTYTICLCNNGKEFQRLTNVADIPSTHPAKGDVIEHKWLVLGVRKESTPNMVLVDVEKVPE